MSDVECNVSESDQANINQFKENYNVFLQNLNERAKDLTDNKEIFTKTYQATKAKVFQNIDNTTQSKVIQLDKKFSQLNGKFDAALQEAELRKQELDAQIQIFENLSKSFEASKEKTQFQNVEQDFTEDDALMINDYYELNDSQIKPSQSEIKTKMEETAKTIEILMSENLEIENLLNEISNGKIDINQIDLDLIQMNGSNNQESPSLDWIDHTKFKMETELAQNFTFVKNQKNFIMFSNSENQDKSDDSKSIHKYIRIEMYDSNHTFVPFDLKEKVTPTKHFFRIYFVPQSAGIFSLRIKFKDQDIPNSPFAFVVLNESLVMSSSNTSLASSNFSATSFAMDGYSVKNDESINPNLFKPPMKRCELEHNQEKIDNSAVMSVPSFNAGRGRLLRMRNQANQVQTESIFSEKSVLVNPTVPSLPHKRKSPDNRFDSNNNLVINEEMMDAEDCSDQAEGSSKLQKLGSIDGSMNKFTDQTIPSLFSLNVATGTNSVVFNQRNSSTVNIISNHLRRYANPNGLVRLLDDRQIPPLKAQFQRKFDNLKFPIGVRSCSIRNWMIVCDNGTNSIKIFERSSGELIRQINDDPTKGIKFQRPSAILLNDKKNEMYVKDDKEIFVFDLEQECKLLRKFGNGVLNKPYGLAYDKNENLVCVDANFRQPVVHVFNKETGQVIQTKNYHPVMKVFANAYVLNQKFGQEKILSTRIEPFEKSKVRFICSNNNSVYASDLGRSMVFKTNLDGEIELAFGFQGKKRGEMNEPSGIHVESDGQAILIGDSRNDRLQIYDANGRYKCDVLFLGERIVRPSDIYVDQEGYLYVSCFIQHCVKKYKLISD